MEKIIFVIILFVTSLFLFTIADAAISIDIKPNAQTSHVNFVEGTVILQSDQVFSEDLKIKAYIDGSEITERTVSDIAEVPFSGYAPQYFNYNITADGYTQWNEFQPQNFDYEISASGTRGDPPEEWYLVSTTFSHTLDEHSEFVVVHNGSRATPPPPDNNGDTQWTVTWQNPKVLLEMREACGGMRYNFRPLQKGIWVTRTLLCSSDECADPSNTFCKGNNCLEQWEWEPGTTAVSSEIERFDDTSLSLDWLGIQGGIFKTVGVNTVRLEEGADVEYIGDNDGFGFVRILNYDERAKYSINYIPPNGPILCAYSDEFDTERTDWLLSVPISGLSVTIESPYTKIYTDFELATLFSSEFDDVNCPLFTSDCTGPVVESYDILKTYDPENSVYIMWNSLTKNLTATTTSTTLVDGFILSINILDLFVKTSHTGTHTLSIKLIDSGGVQAENSTTFEICWDYDEDGYCVGEDCDDQNPLVNPGATELCNNEDDNCNNQTDELFFFPPPNYLGTQDVRLGNECYHWEKSACAGVWICDEFGTNLTCSGIQPGSQPEICGNNIDDDCDSWTDDDDPEGCGCHEGETVPCGGHGICKDSGIRKCLNGQWTQCLGAQQPEPEICNGLDDNCDGIVDNLDVDAYESSSVQRTKCQCYGGGVRGTEICDNLDNDCDNQIDEGCRCKVGETRPCGTDVGICTLGTESCGSNNFWSGECEGGIRPTTELCWDDLDNDCNGKIDDGCDLSSTCRNGIRDLNEQGVDCGGGCDPCPGVDMIYIVIIALLIGGYVVYKFILKPRMNPRPKHIKIR